MRRTWENTSRLLPDTDMREIMMRMRFSKRCTALEQLRDFYRRFAVLGFIMAAVGPWWPFSRIVAPEWRIPLAVMICAYFLTGATMDTILWRRISRIDVVTMPVGEVAAIAHSCRRFHHQCMAVLLVAACVMIGMIIAAFDRGFMTVAILLGVVVGAVIGLTAYFRIMRSYRDLDEE